MIRWKEPAKTLLLTLLVLSSFLLTALLWTNQPQFQLIEPAQYKESKPVQERQLEDLIAPESVIFHYGEDRHTKATATDGQYRIVKEEMKKWIFLDFAPFSLPIEKWEKISREKQGIEIRFRNSVPLSVVGRLVTFRDEVSDKGKGIDRLVLYYEEEEDVVYALFILSGEEMVLRSRTSISPKDLRQSYLPTGNLMPEQIMKVVKPNPVPPIIEQGRAAGTIYYLPKNPVKMQAFRFTFRTIDNDQLLDAYFLDRTLVRQIVERDKTIIYTDGSRSIQLRSDQQAITFTDPAILSVAPELTDEEKVKAAISFINKHLGWTDDFHFETIRKSYNDKDVVTFRQYVGAYPLYSKEGYPDRHHPGDDGGGPGSDDGPLTDRSGPLHPEQRVDGNVGTGIVSIYPRKGIGEYRADQKRISVVSDGYTRGLCGADPDLGSGSEQLSQPVHSCPIE